MQYATAHFLRVARTECIGEEETSAQNQPRKFLVRLASREAALTVCETVLKHRCLLTHRGATFKSSLFCSCCFAMFAIILSATVFLGDQCNSGTYVILLTATLHPL